MTWNIEQFKTKTDKILNPKQPVPENSTAIWEGRIVNKRLKIGLGGLLLKARTFGVSTEEKATIDGLSHRYLTAGGTLKPSRWIKKDDQYLYVEEKSQMAD